MSNLASSLGRPVCTGLKKMKCPREREREREGVLLGIMIHKGGLGRRLCTDSAFHGTQDSTPPFVVLRHRCGALRYRALTSATGSGVGSLVHFLTKLELRRRASISDSCRCRMARNFFAYSLSSLIFTVSCPHQEGGERRGRRGSLVRVRQVLPLCCLLNVLAQSEWVSGGARNNQKN